MASIIDHMLSKPNLQLVLVKLSSLCNIKCSYCYIYETGYRNSLKNQPKLITEETVNNLAFQLNEIRNFYDDFQVTLHGGEPLLVGNDRLEFVLEKLSVTGSLSIQTNGTLITKEILDTLYKYNCSIGISLDGKQSDNDKFRVYRNGKGSFEKVKKGLDLLLDHPISENNFSIIIGVIDPLSDPIETYEYLMQFKPKNIDFLFKDGYHGKLPDGKSSLDSKEYGRWLTKLAFHYLSLDEIAIPIRKIDGLIEDYIKSKLGYPTAFPFGMVVINPNGEITKNELYDISPIGTNFSRNWNVNRDHLLELLMSKEYKLYTLDIFPTSKKCINCKYLNHCSGGYEIHSRWSNENGLENPTIFCSDYEFFFEKVGKYLDQQLDDYVKKRNLANIDNRQKYSSNQHLPVRVSN